MGERPIVFRHSEPKLNCLGVGQVGPGITCGITQAALGPCEDKETGPQYLKRDLAVLPCWEKAAGNTSDAAKDAGTGGQHDHDTWTTFPVGRTRVASNLRVGSQSALLFLLMAALVFSWRCADGRLDAHEAGRIAGCAGRQTNGQAQLAHSECIRHRPVQVADRGCLSRNGHAESWSTVVIPSRSSE